MTLSLSALEPVVWIIMNKERLMRILERNEYDWWYAPSIGFIQDFGKIYWELHNAILEELGEEPYLTPVMERARYDKMKREEKPNE